MTTVSSACGGTQPVSRGSVLGDSREAELASSSRASFALRGDQPVPFAATHVAIEIGIRAVNLVIHMAPTVSTTTASSSSAVVLADEENIMFVRQPVDVSVRSKLLGQHVGIQAFKTIGSCSFVECDSNEVAHEVKLGLIQAGYTAKVQRPRRRSPFGAIPEVHSLETDDEAPAAPTRAVASSSSTGMLCAVGRAEGNKTRFKGGTKAVKAERATDDGWCEGRWQEPSPTVHYHYH